VHLSLTQWLGAPFKPYFGLSGIPQHSSHLFLSYGSWCREDRRSLGYPWDDKGEGSGYRGTGSRAAPATGS
jgi:hypothetical protein